MFAIGNGLLALKRVIGAILTAALSVGYSLGLSFDIQGTFYNPKSYLTYSFYDSTYKVGYDEFIDGKASYEIKLAGNECEACQIVVRSRYNSAMKLFRLEFTDFVNEKGERLESEIFEEKYIACVSERGRGDYPDALAPLSDNPLVFAPRPRINHPFYIRVKAGANTPAGKYKAQIKATDEEGEKVEFIAEVSATVWDFDLPEKPSCKTAFGIDSSSLNRVYYAENDPVRAQRIYKNYYDFLIERKITPYSIPYDLLSDEADAYMDDPRVTSFLIPYCAGDDAGLQRYYAKVQSNPQWAEKGYFYPIDEPRTLEDYERYYAITDRLKRLCPGYHIITPFENVSTEPDENGATYYHAELQAGRGDTVCPQPPCFDDAEFLKQIEKRRADGSEIWRYVCCGTHGDYCNFFIHWEGIKGRLLFWQQKAFDAEGLLYWGTTSWGGLDSPWATHYAPEFSGGFTAFGDGALLYNGDGESPVSSLRLEEISDGIEDFEYLTIAEGIFGREYVNGKIARVSRALTDYTLDDALLARVRAEIGSDIEKNSFGD